MQLKRAEGLAWRKLGDETIVINLEKKMMYGLNAEAGELWEALEAGLDLNADSRAADESVTVFISDLLAEGLASGDVPPSTGPVSSASGPRLLWKEEVQQFAGGCGFQAGQGGICDNAPLSS